LGREGEKRGEVQDWEAGERGTWKLFLSWEGINPDRKKSVGEFMFSEGGRTA